MKKFVVSLVSIVTLLVPTQVLAENWVPVSGRLMIDTDSIAVMRNNSNIRYYSEKFTFNRSGYTKHRRIANCANGRTNILEFVNYNNFGQVVGRTSFDLNGREVGYIRPGSDAWRSLNIACR